MGSSTEWQQQCRVEWQEAKLQQHKTSAQNLIMHKCDVLLSTPLMLRESVEILCIWGSISCALAPKLCGGTRVHLIYKTQNWIWEISSGLGDIKLINYFKCISYVKT